MYVFDSLSNLTKWEDDIGTHRTHTLMSHTDLPTEPHQRGIYGQRSVSHWENCFLFQFSPSTVVR